MGLRVGLELPQYDTRELPFSGVAFERQGDLFVSGSFNTDPNRRLSASGDLFGFRLFGVGLEQPGWGWGTDLQLIWHPLDALETRVDASYGHKPTGARWVDTVGTTAIFGWQDPMFLSVTLRQQVVLTPRLTFQVYAQLFSGAVQYQGFYAADLAGRTSLPGTALAAAAWAGNPSGHFSALNLNAVLRWEYRLGSTLYVVYTHAQQERATAGAEVVSASVWPSQLFHGPASDTFLVKWTWWLSV